MQNNILRIFMWVFAITSLIGNLVVLIMQCKTKAKNEIQEVQAILVGNLSFADLLMGVYMLVIVSADLIYGDEYYMHSDYWRESVVCKIANFLAVLSSEASLFIIVLITSDRYLCLVFPLRPSIHFNRFSIIIAVLAIWTSTIGLSLTTSLVAGDKNGVYILSDVCIGIPLIRRISSFNVAESGIASTVHGQVFSTEVAAAFDVLYFPVVIFLGTNLLLLVTMTILYIVIYCAIVRAGKVKKSKRVSEHISRAILMTVIVGTNCLCWVPIICMGILSQSGLVTFPIEFYHWSAVFLLPINASINPYLYTLADVISRRIGTIWRKIENLT